MRVTHLLTACCLSLMVAAPAIAQQAQAQAPAPTRSVDDYVCAFAGECGTRSTPDNSIAAPNSRGFRLSVPERHNGTSGQPQAQSATTSVRTNDASRSRVGASKGGGHSRGQAAASGPRRMDLRVSFVLGSAELTAQAQQEAKVFADALARPELEAKRFLIEGHTDSSGSRSMNMDLSKRRAQAVADYLASLGVRSDRLEVRGYGPDRPLPGHRPSSPDNRRVEAQLL